MPDCFLSEALHDNMEYFYPFQPIKHFLLLQLYLYFQVLCICLWHDCFYSYVQSIQLHTLSVLQPLRDFQERNVLNLNAVFYYLPPNMLEVGQQLIILPLSPQSLVPTLHHLVKWVLHQTVPEMQFDYNLHLPLPIVA